MLKAAPRSRPNKRFLQSMRDATSTRRPAPRKNAERVPNGACRARHCAGSAIRFRDALRTMPMPGNPRVAPRRTALPAQKEAAGARAARSQPSNTPPKRPRCSCDAGSPKADQKAGARVFRRAVPSPVLSSPFPCVARHLFVERKESQARAAARVDLGTLQRDASPG